jgi:hypothetical protein
MRKVAAVFAVVLGVLALVACGDDGDSASDTTTTDQPTGTAAPEPTVIEGAGAIDAQVEDYRALLGDGFLEVNWDGVPDEFASPNALPSDFFNDTEEPRARGLVLETPGDNVAVSADAENPDGAAVRFGDINPTYVDTFRAFSEERLFSPVGSNIVDITFFVPGTDTPGVVRGFGAVYTSVDVEETAAFEFFDADGASLGTYSVPVSEDGLSFLGVAFSDAIVARVRIVYGNTALGPDDDEQYDVAVMDNFIYDTPVAIGG